MASIMATPSLNEKDWQKLLRTIERGQCVLMLGSEIPFAAEDAPSSSLTTVLARRLAEQLGDKAKCSGSDGLSQVAQAYLAHRIGDRDDLEMDVETFYQAYQSATTALHESLAQLPFRYCISMTPDDMMATAFEQAGKKPQRAYYHFRSGNRPLAAVAERDTPLVYKLFGTTDDSRSLVLSESDLLDFLANIISGCPELPPALGKLFSASETSFLFIGFGFQHWYWRILLHVFRKQLNTALPPWSLALEDVRFFDDPLHEQITVFYDHSHAIEFKYCSWNALAEGLLRRYREKQAAPLAPEPALPTDAPTVFLCHSAKDSEAVGTFGAKMRSRGINTWRDRDNLRGGDNWDRRIKHLIDNEQIDYFLVLQTPRMLAEAQSYFVQEIHLALQRQEKNWSDFIFIIPAFFAGNGCEKLEALGHLNFLDLVGEKDLDRLIKDIHADRAKRLTRKASALREQAHAD